ncbi:MAG: tryptophan--tRNA ligase [Candidatus Pacebacteria bacterium]|nr:tryptophan--tRNA ligase [Candidatus Paceibacterota bacterium]
MKKKVFSGIQPTGNIHIGNYLGAIKNWVDSQPDFDNIFCVVDLHAITVKQDPKILKEKITETAGLLLACGIDAEKSTLFVQSRIPAHSELAWILNCFTPMGWMEKMTQFKEKSHKAKIGLPAGRENSSVGLFDYPALMAADILLYGTEAVPVGEDQKQHVELARDIAKRFNSIYGETFVLPEAVIRKTGNRIMGLQNPGKKMSKSENGEGNVINLLDSPDKINSKISKAATDSGKEIVFDKGRPGIYNLLTIYEMFSGLEKKNIEKKFGGKGYAEFKKDLAELVIQKLTPIQERYKKMASEPGKIDEILKQGAEKVRPLAEKKLAEVKSKIGLG